MQLGWPGWSTLDVDSELGKGHVALEDDGRAELVRAIHRASRAFTTNQPVPFGTRPPSSFSSGVSGTGLMGRQCTRPHAGYDRGRGQHAPASERHLSHRTGWLRAAVLGANDGIVSTASIIVGVAAADSGRPAIVTAGIAGLVAGAASMAAGEYVSVSSQADAERADLALEQRELQRPGR